MPNAGCLHEYSSLVLVLHTRYSQNPSACIIQSPDCHYTFVTFSTRLMDKKLLDSAAAVRVFLVARMCMEYLSISVLGT